MGCFTSYAAGRCARSEGMAYVLQAASTARQSEDARREPPRVGPTARQTRTTGAGPRWGGRAASRCDPLSGIGCGPTTPPGEFPRKAGAGMMLALLLGVLFLLPGKQLGSFAGATF